MPPRNPELPEGTDHIINGAMETGAGADASTGSSGVAGGGAGGSGGGDAGTAAISATGGSTGSSAAAGGGGDNGAGGFVGSAATGDDTGGSTAPVRQQLRDGAQSLKSQATDRVRNLAEDGKSRATSALDDFSEMLSETATTIDERLGGDYGQYARRASEAVSGLADTLRERDVDQIYEDARSYVRKSPGVALGIAAVVGFTLARMVKAGLPDGEEASSGGGTGSAGGKGGGTQTRA